MSVLHLVAGSMKREDQYGADQVLRLLRQWGPQPHLAYELNDWSPAQMLELDEVVDAILDQLMELRAQVRLDLGVAIAPVRRPVAVTADDGLDRSVGSTLETRSHYFTQEHQG